MTVPQLNCHLNIVFALFCFILRFLFCFVFFVFSILFHFIYLFIYSFLFLFISVLNVFKIVFFCYLKFRQINQTH